MRRRVSGIGAIVCILACGGRPLGATELGIDGTGFTIDRKPVFLLGASYYGGTGASDEILKRDLDDLGRDGFNWIRVWATWAAFDNDVSAVNGDGSPREPYLGRLANLVSECDRRGVVVDVTLSRQNGATGPPRLLEFSHHRRAVETLIERLKPLRNWYLDLGNERNVRDARFVPADDLKRLRERVRELDPQRLVTASHSSGDDEFIGELDAYLRSIKLDFVSPHRGRYAATAGETETMTGRYFARMHALDRVVPVHYQEPFRRGYGEWKPGADDFFSDLRGAIAGGAAGWCFHNGGEGRDRNASRRRSFDLREKRLYAQLDDVETQVVRNLQTVAREAMGARRASTPPGR